MLLTPELIKLRLKKLGIRADKYLGQRFLISQGVLDTIVDHAKTFIQPGDTILEIGPGLGVLTDELTQLSHPLIAVEKDPVFAQGLANFLGSPNNLTVIEGDILRQLDINHVFQTLSEWCVVANIPYAITSPLLRKLTYLERPPHHILVLVQKESAERINASPGNPERGLLTLEIEIMAESDIITHVPKREFWPPPEVESALLLLKLRTQPLIDPKSIPSVLRIAAAGFSAKRKQLQNSLAGGLRLSAEEVSRALTQASIEPTRRAETLSVEEWSRLTEMLAKAIT